MAIKPIISTPKGNAGMTLVSSRNDDSTVSLPDMGFDFMYNSSKVRIIYTSGNTWVGFGSSSEHITINRKDTSANSIYYKHEIENGTKSFRIRFEGNSYYGSWGSNDLIWEISIYETGVFTLIIEKMPNNGTNSFVNSGIGTQSLSIEANKSYVFVPGGNDGKNFSIVEGSYFPHKEKFLIVDNEEIKNYQTIGGVSSWVKIADLPITEELLINFGNDSLPASTEGLIDDSPMVYYYTDNLDVIENTDDYKLNLNATATSLPKIIRQEEDFLIHTGKEISNITLDISTNRKDSSGNNVNTNGKVRLLLSTDEGTIWLTYNIISGAFEELDIEDMDAFLSNGIDPTKLSVINYNILNGLIEQNRKLSFAYVLEKPTFQDVCKLKKLKIFYA